MIYLAVGGPAYRVVLTGSGTQAPFAAVSFPRQGAPGESVEDYLDLGLEGSPAALGEGLAALERWLDEARTEARQSARGDAGPGVRLYLKEVEEETSLSSPVLDGWVEKLKGQRSGRSLAVRLHLTRLNYWEDTFETALPLSNLHGTGQTTLSVDNHQDGSHCNWVDVCPDPLNGDLPLPVILRLENTFAGAALGVVHVYHQRLLDASPEAFPGWLEGEAASGGTPITDAGASAGAFNRLAWNGSSEAALCSWTLSSTALYLAAGRFFQPVLRFHAAPPEGTRLRVQILDGSYPLWEGAPAWIRPGDHWQILPAVQVPPQQVVVDPMKPLTLSLSAQIKEDGAHTLDLDALQLAPLDGWRRLLPLAGGLAQGSAVTDDNRSGVVYLSTPGSQAGYSGAGPTLTLMPGANSRLFFFQSGLDGQAEIGRTLNVRLKICRRFRRP